MPKTESIKCVDCGIAIPKIRLEALPNTVHCVKCAEKTEQSITQLPFDDSYNAEDCRDILSNDD